jgi:N-acetylglucosamine kinase-like BadF-type ATPase
VAAFGEGPGILLLAGTGSGACARLPSGEVRRVGGHGWQFGDEGSGYALARAALSAAARASDGRGPATTLTEALARTAGVESPEALLQWARAAPRSAVADLAATVQEVSGRDAVARQLVDDAARDLAAHVGPLQSLFPTAGGVSLAMAGGLVRGPTAMRRAVTQALERVSGLRLLDDLVEPPRGALQLAQRLTVR